MKPTVLFLLSATLAVAQSQVPAPASPSHGATPPRVQVDAETSSKLIVQKSPIIYPDAAQSAGIQGAVMLNVVVSDSGDVKEVTVLSGDSALGQAAADAVKKWKYKPYRSDGSPAEMETQISVNFHIAPRPEPGPPSLGQFRYGIYSNDTFGIYYPLSRDWVLETNRMRTQVAAENGGSMPYVLLAAVHIPANNDALRADSTFAVLALRRAGMPASDDCQRFLELVATDLHLQKTTSFTGTSGAGRAKESRLRHLLCARSQLLRLPKSPQLQTHPTWHHHLRNQQPSRQTAEIRKFAWPPPS